MIKNIGRGKRMENETKLLILSYISFTIIIGLFLVNQLVMHNDIIKMRDNIEGYNRAKMYGRDLRELARVNGVYFAGSDYFCIWTKDRNSNDINETVSHEQCHDFVYKDWEHFCSE